MSLARRHLLQHVVWGKSFEESLMLGHSLLESGQVICLQVLLHLRHLVIQQWFLLGCYFGKLLSASPGFSFPHPGQPLLGGLEIWSRWPGMKPSVVFPSVDADKDTLAVWWVLHRLGFLRSQNGARGNPHDFSPPWTCSPPPHSPSHYQRIFKEMLKTEKVNDATELAQWKQPSPARRGRQRCQPGGYREWSTHRI